MHKGRRLAGAVRIEPGDGPVEVRLAPCGSAIGRLVDPDGQPLAGAMIQLQPQDHGGEPLPGGIGLWPEGEVFTADKDGRFRVEGINPELGVRCRSARGRSPTSSWSRRSPRRRSSSTSRPKPGETVDLGEIRMIPQPKG